MTRFRADCMETGYLKEQKGLGLKNEEFLSLAAILVVALILQQMEGTAECNPSSYNYRIKVHQRQAHMCMSSLDRSTTRCLAYVHKSITTGRTFIL